jgi:hypothetical protein
MAFSALVFLAYEFWRLIWQPDHIGSWRVHPGAIDLKIRHRAVHAWFAGKPVYDSGYAPASYLIFWPLHGWLAVRPAILIWATSTVAALAWLVYLVVWLCALGLGDYILPAMFFVLLALGFWTYCYRHVDLWLLLGVAGLVARFWTYHRWYDDLLFLLPMIALFRIAKDSSSSDRIQVLAGALLAITVLASIAPGGLYLLPAPWDTLYVDGQVVVWGCVLMSLLNFACRERNAQTLERNGYRVGV